MRARRRACVLDGQNASSTDVSRELSLSPEDA
jgi:hypothetical protein